MKRSLVILFLLISSSWLWAADYLVFEGKPNLPGSGKHVVLLSGDEEYRSEEGLPQLAQILSQRHGFKCTVLFSINPKDGTVDPTVTSNIPGAEALDSADVIVMLLRFRAWPDDQMKHFVDAYLKGKPIIALRTSTHAFKYDGGSSPYKKYSYNSKDWPGGFGKQVLGETWVAHHGDHKKQATGGIIPSEAAQDPILRGVRDVFGDSDVYAANPPADARILVRGAVLNGMSPDDKPVAGPKNNPMQPVTWTRLYKNEAGTTNRIFCTTMGAATDLKNEGLRRLIVNAVYWGAALNVAASADVATVGDYQPSAYGFGGYKKGLKPEQFISTSAGESQASSATTAAPLKLELKPETHIALIGNTLADRFQHSGWLETFIQARFPEQHLVFRNLAVAGDEVVIRHRPADFGSPDQWLEKVQADVIFAFFGFNESFHGKAGLKKFSSDLDKFLKETRAKKYSSRGSPTVVLFSPPANERHPDPNFPDPTANNRNIEMYAQEMRKVAARNGVLFVDLFNPSKSLLENAARQNEALTINGMHLTEQGDNLIAQVMFKALFHEEAPMAQARKDTASGSLTIPGKSRANVPASEFLEKLRSAVAEKNEEWHSRYRTVDGNNVFGGRSALAYQPGKGGFITDRTPPEPYVSNFKVMQEEMSQRDVKTANRDKRVWAVAAGGDLKVDDSNLPPVTQVKPNLAGPNPDQSFPFLGAQEAIAKMKVHSGMKVNLFASEERFPELAKPVQMEWDTRGRLWVAAWPNYPERTPDSTVGDSLLVFEDTDGDGVADKCTHFKDNLNAPTGFQFYKDGVLLVQAPDLWFLRDTKGSGSANTMERVLMGLSSADSHHTANALCLDPGGAIYLSDGVFHRTQVETISGPVRNNDAAIYRYEPRTGKFETYVAYHFANPHGRVFDYWGDDLITDATGNNTYFGPAFSGHLDHPAKHSTMKEFWKRPSRPCPGTAILTSRHFPEEFQGNFLNCNVISFQGIYRVKVSPDGSGLKGETMENLISSSDPNFRPTTVNVGPDGAIYLADWQNPLIGHMQHHLRDPNRDHIHGRIYRITYPGRPLLEKPQIAGRPVPELLKLLSEPENLTRQLATVEIGNHEVSEVLPAIKRWIAALDTKSAHYQHDLMEALWVEQSLNHVEPDLLKRMLASPDPKARAAAGRVLCYTRDRIQDALDLFAKLADDENPRVRLEAVRDASFFNSSKAVDVALTVLKHSTDYYLDYTLQETMRQLEPIWRQALEKGSALAAANSVGRAYVLKKISTPELLKLPQSATIMEAIMERSDAADADRMVALGNLASARKKNLTETLLEQIDACPPTDVAAISALAGLLPYQAPEALHSRQQRLDSYTHPHLPAKLRQAAWVAMVVADKTFDKVWPRAANSEPTLVDLLNGIPMISDPSFRSLSYDRVAEVIYPRSGSAKASNTVLEAGVRALAAMNTSLDRTFALFCNLLRQGQGIPTIVSGIRALPRTAWKAGAAPEATQDLVAWAKQTPPEKRNSEEYSETVETAGEMASLLPTAQRQDFQKTLASLKVPLFVIRSVREQMRYNTSRLVVEAGKPFSLIFQNDDFMPHNVVMIRPGTRETVGLAAAKLTPEALDAEGRAYVPAIPEIIGATRLLTSGQKETLNLTAPAQVGDYEYCCTFPGHYQVMWGSLIITKDVDAYLAAHPVAPVGGIGATLTHVHDGKTAVKKSEFE
jgi:glucose/arabinose dehydrogenase/azurin/HEAT repeat protein